MRHLSNTRLFHLRYVRVVAHRFTVVSGLNPIEALALAWAKVRSDDWVFAKGWQAVPGVFLGRIDGATEKEGSKYYAEILERVHGRGNTTEDRRSGRGDIA